MSSPQEMWDALPPITKAWLGTSAVSTALVSFGMLDPTRLMFYMPWVIEKFEIWRFLSAFIFFGKFSFPFLMQMFILARFSSNYEADPFKTSYAGGTPDYVFSLLVMGTACLIVGWYMNMPFMGSILVFAVLYLWSKRNPEAPSSIWGFRFKGSQLPFAMLAFTVLIGGSPIPDLIGIAIGHTYYFVVEVLPLSNNKQILQTPEFLIRFVGSMTGEQIAAPPPRPGVVPPPGRHNWGGGGRVLGAAQ